MGVIVNNVKNMGNNASHSYHHFNHSSYINAKGTQVSNVGHHIVFPSHMSTLNKLEHIGKWKDGML